MERLLLQLENNQRGEPISPGPTTQVVEGDEKIAGLSVISSSKIVKSLCVCGHKDLPQVIAVSELFHEIFKDLKNRGVKVQFATEITKENVAHCKKIIEEFDVELRHIDEVKGNFAVSDGGRQYWASARIPSTENSVAHMQLVWSTVPAIAEQNQYVFELLWNKALPGESRFKEIEVGFYPTETKVIQNPQEIIKEIRRACETSAQSLSFYTDSDNMVQGYKLFLDAYKKALQNHSSNRERSGNESHSTDFRWLVQIDPEDDPKEKTAIIEAVRALAGIGIAIRHTDAPPMLKFALKDSEELYATFESAMEGRIVLNVLFSNEQAYVKQFEEVFEESWRKSRDAKERIRELEEGIEPTKTEIINNVSEARRIARECFENCEKEILIIVASQQVIERNLSLYQEMIEAAIKGKVKIRVLLPAKNGETPNFLEGVDWRAIDQMNVGYAIYDRKKMLITQYATPDDLGVSLNRIQANIFTTNRAHISGIVSAFDALWRETELRETAERSRREAELLQDILSHDIRNFNQAARINAEILEEDATNEDAREMLASIINSIDGSTALVERAAKIGKIIAAGSDVKLFPVNLNATIQDSLTIVKRSQPEKKIFLDLEKSEIEGSLVLADEMLAELFVNLFSNSAKYTESEIVRIKIRTNYDSNFFKISIEDQGRGIPDEQKLGLFTRYVKNAHGTGLGLSIAHALVIDRYQGKITLRNRVVGDYRKGTVVDLHLPRG